MTASLGGEKAGRRNANRDRGDEVSRGTRVARQYRPQLRSAAPPQRIRIALLFRDSGRGYSERLSHFGPLLEIGAGKGYWAWELRKAGVDIVATDAMGLGRYWKSGHWRKPWTAIEPLDAKTALRKYPGRTLLSVWPDRGRDWPSQMLRLYQGRKLLYVGEGPGGCTGNYEFHKILHEDFACEGVFPIPNFYGKQDMLWVWERRKSAIRRLRSKSFGSLAARTEKPGVAAEEARV